jgi:predicted DNA-binding protein (UPF0251 family)
MPCSEYGCPVGTCRNLVADPLAPCDDCVALFGHHLRPAGREAGEEERAAQLARAEAKAARISPALVPIRRPGRPPRLTAEELAEEALHLIWCGVSREQAARQLGVTKPALEAALRRIRAAA